MPRVLLVAAVLVAVFASLFRLGFDDQPDQVSVDDCLLVCGGKVFTYTPEVCECLGSYP